MQLPRLAIVDLETTGADPHHDRITEIAIILTDGEQLLEQWSTLINPDKPIPERIQNLVGITNEMVQDAPRFADLASTIRSKLDGVIFVAHNARFDYSFLRAEFEKIQMLWDASVLCTVKFSRALDPQYPRHGLDAIIERHSYSIDARHRALDDAKIVWRFLLDAIKRADSPRLQHAWEKAFSTTPVPRLPRGDLDALPGSPGAYIFRNIAGHILQIGRTRDLRAQILGIFTTNRPDAKTRKLAATVHDVETWPCAGELGAQLKEIQLQRSAGALKPEQAFAWEFDTKLSPVLQLRCIVGSNPYHWVNLYGNFRGEKEAKTALKELSRKYNLCLTRIGLESAENCRCQAHHIGHCKGVCIGAEAPHEHDKRLATALSSFKLRNWPWAIPIIWRENHEATQLTQTFLLDQWCVIGTSESGTQTSVLKATEPVFDADICRLLLRWFNSPERLGQAITPTPDT